MYEYLDGRLESRHGTRVVVGVNGVGYSVSVVLGSDFRPAPGGGADGDVRVWTHLVVRDDAHELYGFVDPDARELFRLLLSVRGVGPSLALGILSHLEGDSLLRAVAAEDARALQAVKGVGKKTAEQILLDLRGKAPAVAGAHAGDPDVLVPVGARGPQTHEDAVRALISIGYSDKEARRNVERAADKLDTDDLETLVRAALQHG